MSREHQTSRRFRSFVRRPSLHLCLVLAAMVALAAATTARADDKPADAKAADSKPAGDTPAAAAKFRVGVATRDVTPQAPTPMWGYGDRHALLSQGTLDPLYAKAIVIVAGDAKLAIVGTDIGRGPTQAMMTKIRKELKDKAEIDYVMIGGSHSHHGPVTELTDREGFGKGKFDDAVKYARELPDTLIEVILEADKSARPARIGAGKTNINYNRNRHSKRQPKPTDPMLAVIRFDDEAGKPIAVLVNFAAHPTMISGAVLKFSADYPGAMKKKVEEKLATHCVFMQGASGDMSANPPEGVRGHEQFGQALADRVIEIAGGIQTSAPAKPSIQGRTDHFTFSSRVDFLNPLIAVAYGRAFFPELVRNFVDEFRGGVTPELNTILLNGQIALVGGSGEFFCNHSNRLKERSYAEHTLFFGYCNGHHMYLPTIEAVSEGGYGADPPVSPIEIGGGEQIMNRALINIYTMLGKFPEAKPTAATAAK